MRDSALIDLLRNRKSEGADMLLQQYGPLIRYIINPILSDYREQEECLSDVAYRIWDKIEQYDENNGSFKSWISTIARNTAYNRAKRNQKHDNYSELSNELPATEKSPEEQIILKEKLKKLQDLLSTLSINDRTLIYRKYYYLQSTEQIAAELGLTARAVEGRLYRIKKKLRGEWDER